MNISWYRSICRLYTLIEIFLLVLQFDVTLNRWKMFLSSFLFNWIKPIGKPLCYEVTVADFPRSFYRKFLIFVSSHFAQLFRPNEREGSFNGWRSGKESKSLSAFNCGKFSGIICAYKNRAEGLKLFKWECEKLICHESKNSAACVSVTELCNEMCELDNKNRRARTLTHVHDIGESDIRKKAVPEKRLRRWAKSNKASPTVTHLPSYLLRWRKWFNPDRARISYRPHYVIETFSPNSMRNANFFTVLEIGDFFPLVIVFEN